MSSEETSLLIKVSDAAKADIEHEIDYLLGEAGDRIALRYVAALEKTLQLISDFPQIGTLCPFTRPPLSELRRKPLSGRFASRLVFYLIAEDYIQIVRILHGRQNWIALLQPTEPS